MKFNYLFFWSDQKAYIFFKLSLIYFIKQSQIFEVRLSNIKTSFSTTSMQILRRVTDMWAEVVGITNYMRTQTISLTRFSCISKTTRVTCSITSVMNS